MKKIKKKWIIGTIIVLAVSGIAISALMPKKSPATPVDTVKITKGNIKSIVEVKGAIEANDTAEITSPYNYKVVAINVKEGDKVQKEQILASLDAKNLQDEITILKKEIAYDELKLQENYNDASKIYKSTESLELNVQNAKLALDTAKLNLDSAQNALNNANNTVSKNKELFDADAIAKQDLDTAITAQVQAQSAYEQAKVAYEQASVAYTQAQESVKKGKHDIKTNIEQATPKQSAKEAINIKKTTLEQKLKRLEDLNIKSPISGTVTRVYAKLGRNAQATQDNKPMFIIEDDSKKYLVAKIGEYDISKIKLNQDVTISAEVLGTQEIKGKIDRISPTGEKSSNGNSIVIPVRILISQTDSRLITGVTAKAKIKTDEVKDILKTSFDAIYNQDDKDYVFAIENNKLKKIQIQKGLETNFETQITSTEIKPDMDLVKNPTTEMTDGMDVFMNVSEDKKSKENINKK